ncbi:prepilin-type N-terminal cleavage/methylation domain-containing protein [Lacisediminihabitans sp.]|jgi:prepilin-type N-terminal cleavage/methylation domain-containing protein|uniref:PilW family protein n=1 Tax=Lacisediminihabitans sp. TaxID=2787631 RepID=UPI002F948C62
MVERSPRAASIRDADAGFSLVELMVAMAIFTIFVAVILTSIVAISRSAVRTQLVGQSTNSTLVVFGSLDRQVRYSDSINYPGVGTSGNRYVEFRVPAASTAGGLQAICYQWRFSVADSRLESRQWNESDPTTATAWSPKLTDVANDGDATHPFQLIQANGTDTPSQQLLITLNPGTDAQKAGASMSTTFVARNTSDKSRSHDPLTPVCTFGAYRP